MSKKQLAESAYQLWCQQVKQAAGKPDGVLALYHPDAILLPTVQSGPLSTPDELRAYFESFTAKENLSAKTITLMTHEWGNVVINSGIYEFSFNDTQGQQQTVAARFSFAYDIVDDQCLIINHHSSKIPD